MKHTTFKQLIREGFTREEAYYMLNIGKQIEEPNDEMDTFNEFVKPRNNKEPRD